MINTTSARVAIALATSSDQRVPAWCGLVAGSDGASSNIAALLHGLDCGRVLAAVDECDEVVRAWLLFTYAAEAYAPKRAAHQLTAALYLEHARRRTLRMEPGRAANLAGAVMIDLYHRYRCPAMTPATTGHYARALQLPVNRVKDFAHTVAGMIDIVERWDASGLKVVAAALPYHIRTVA